MQKSFFITTPIYYPSGSAHLGHCYSTVVADVIARYKRLRGYNVFFSTGTDEHGQKIESNATLKGLKPADYIDPIVQNFKRLWKMLNIDYSCFIRTTSDNHKKTVQKIFKILFDKGLIYKDEYEGWYCLPCEGFFSDLKLVNGKCPDCGREVKKQSEEAYFFKLSKYSEKLLDFYSKNPSFVQPESRRNEMIQFVKSGLEDLCVSRVNFSWGVAVPFDLRHTVYVWLDALVNYITVLDYNNSDQTFFKSFWPADIHIVGKEIVRFHAVIWPAVLMALDLPLPKCIYGHGWLLFSGDKMSKSKGNVVDPFTLCEKYGQDAIRYFLMREVPFGSDGSFDLRSLIKRINFDLANDLGNLISRSTSLAHNYFIINENFDSNYIKLTIKEQLNEDDLELIEKVKDLIKLYEKNMENLKFSLVLANIWELISFCNKYVNLAAPWKLSKTKDSLPKISKILYNIFETIRIVSVLILPFMPETSKKIRDIIGYDTGDLDLWSTLKWGMLKEDTKIIRNNSLFPRVDFPIDSDQEKEIKVKDIKKDGLNSEISIEEFERIDLRVVKVLECQKVKKSEKLIRFVVFDGKNIRTIISGVAGFYKEEELVNRNVISVLNVKPIKLCGIYSEGMILSVLEGDIIKIVFADDLKPGSKLL